MACAEVFEKNEKTPMESYTFTYTTEEYDEAVRSVLQGYTVRTVVTGILFAAITAGVIMSDMTDFLGGFLVGWTLIYFLMSLAGLLQIRKNWKSTKAKVCSSENKYELFDDYLLFTVTRDGECVHFTKLEYDKLRRKIDTGNMYLLDFANQGYLIKKQEIAENSVFHSIKPKEPEKPSATLKSLSVALLVLTIVSGISGVLCVNVQLISAGAIKWWCLLAFSALPLASFIFGIYMKKYGGGRGNLFAGLLVLVVIFTVFFSVNTKEPVDAEKSAQIEAVESYMGVFLPEPYSYDNFKGSVNGIDYEDTAMQFNSEAGDFIEGIIKGSDKWSAILTDEIYDLVYEVGTAEDWDYVCVYNITNDEYNKVPLKEGTYDMAAMYYDMEYNGLYVIEYEYAK